MPYVEIVAALALLQYVVFAALVGRARGTYGVHAPAVTGHVMFERLYRLQMNTLELLVVFVPSLWLAAHYVSPLLVASAGVVYLLGRVIYFKAYAQDPARRTLGFALSIAPTLALLLTGLGGALWALWSFWML